MYNMKVRLRRICILIHLLFIIILLARINIIKYADSISQDIKSQVICNEERQAPEDAFKTKYVVGILGDMKIAGYLWFEILNTGKDVIYKDKKFIFKIMNDSTWTNHHGVLVVGNGRSTTNIIKLKSILDGLDFSPSSIKKIGLLMIGHEFCANNWIKKYLKSQKGILSFIFTTYNAIEISTLGDSVHHWPLGVASYRNFPHVISADLNLDVKRPYFSNFMGTVYKNSSREMLIRDLKKNLFKGNRSLCFLSYRDKWLPHEPKDSSEMYQSVLMRSDFTLCPVGVNEETYRIYEAMSMASIPIIEDHPPGFVTQEHDSLENYCYSSSSDVKLNKTSSSIPPFCFIKYKGTGVGLNTFLLEEGSYYFNEFTNNIVSLSTVDDALDNPKLHRFLKAYKAPVLFVKKINWDLILTLRRLLTDEDILVWRKILVAWYANFKKSIRESFLDVFV